MRPIERLTRGDQGLALTGCDEDGAACDVPETGCERGGPAAGFSDASICPASVAAILACAAALKWMWSHW